MYTAFYGLREKPFALSPDPRFLFLSEPHREALAHLLYGIEQGEGFIAITGEVGTGKTTLCRTLLRRLGPDVEVAFLFNPQLTPRELVEAIHAELGIESLGGSVRELMDELNRFLLEKSREGRRVLLIVDEAQGLTPQALEQIRLLSNLETESQKLIQILLLGQPELDAMLESDSLRQLRQRIGVRWRLAPLTPRETRAYIRHRLHVAARAERDLFTPAALREVHRRTRGIPRLVNVLCDRALLAGYAARAPRIGPALVRRADRELRPGGTRRRLARRRSALAAAAAVLVLALAGLAATRWSPGAAWLRARLPAADVASAGSAATSSPNEAVAPQEPAAERPAAAAEAVAPEATAGSGSTSDPASALELEAGPDALAAWLSEPAQEDAGASVPSTVENLGEALALRTPGSTASEALRAILDAWGLPVEVEERPFVSFPELLGELHGRELAVLSLPRTDLTRLRLLDHPALLELRAADGVSRVVALRALGEETAWLAGVTPGTPVRVDLAEVERLWSREAYVVWQDFEGLPEVLRRGDVGSGVAWLQLSLQQLGFYRASLSARFDPATVEAVRSFQRARRLEPDGAVGPLTKMALYEALSRYAVPRLSAVPVTEAAGEVG